MTSSNPLGVFPVRRRDARVRIDGRVWQGVAPELMDAYSREGTVFHPVAWKLVFLCGIH